MTRLRDQLNKANQREADFQEMARELNELLCSSECREVNNEAMLRQFREFVSFFFLSIPHTREILTPLFITVGGAKRICRL